MLGFVINPYGNKSELCDEMVIYSKRKFAYAKMEGEKEGMDKLKFSFKNVTIGKLFKEGEKGIFLLSIVCLFFFVFLPFFFILKNECFFLT